MQQICLNMENAIPSSPPPRLLAFSSNRAKAGTQSCVSVGVKTTTQCPTPNKTQWGGGSAEKLRALFPSLSLSPTSCHSYGLERPSLSFKVELSGVFLLPASSSTFQSQALLIEGRMSNGVMAGGDFKSGMRVDVAGSHHHAL